MNGQFDKIGVIGGGAWGTALALAALRAGRQAQLWVYEAELASAINQQHENHLYLKGVSLPPQLTATTQLDALADCGALLIVTPAQHLRRLVGDIKGWLRLNVPLVICAKGIEVSTGSLLGEALRAEIPGHPYAVLSGPTFAIEVAREQPTALTLASDNMDLANALANALASPFFRPYSSPDPIGVEVGGAVKNVIAIACGIATGLGYGDNARAALMTRGLAETTRFAVALGARRDTLLGLAGMGDMVLTCSSQQSRNFSFGFALGQGKSAAEILAERRAVTEGVTTAQAVLRRASSLNIDMPICAFVNAIVQEGADVRHELNRLLSRPLRPEME